MVEIERRVFEVLNKHSILLKAVALNCAFFVVMELMFKPVWQADNAAISNGIYGAYGDTYDYHTNYISFPYAKLVVFFLRCLPGLPWYTILECLWLFFAFTLVTFLNFEKYNNNLGMMINIILLLFFTYEGYVCQQFTKTSAILAVSGMYAVFLSRKRTSIILLGIFLFVIGYLIRDTPVKMTVGAWAVILLFQLIIMLVKKDKNGVKSKAISIGVLLLFVVLFCMAAFLASYEVNQSDEWKEYNKWTYYRSQIQDYPIPDYDSYSEQYKEIGVSENDLLIWYSWTCDPKGINPDTVQQILQFENSSSSKVLLKYLNTSKIAEFFKIFPRAFYSIDVFFAYIIIILLFIFGKENKDFIFKTRIIATFFVLILMNYYLYTNGRYLQHRVDIGIVFAACILVIYLMDEGIDLKFNKRKIAALIVCLLLSVPFKNYGDDRYSVSESMQDQNKGFFTQSSSDRDHYYTFINSRHYAYHSYAAFGAWDCVPIGFFRNIYGNTNPIPAIVDVWESYGFQNPYFDAVDSDIIYITLSRPCFEMLKPIELYIEEHTNQEVQFTLVKEYFDKLIYRVNRRPLEDVYKFQNIKKESEKMVGSVDAVIAEQAVENTGEKVQYLGVSGNMHIKGENGFAQNTYLKIKDAQSDNEKLYYVKQSEDSNYEQSDEAHYSKLSAGVLLPSFYDKKDKVYLIIEYKGKVYQKKLQVDY